MLKEFLEDESGQDMVEYALLMALIAAAAILVLTGMGTSITTLYLRLTQMLDAATNATP